MGAAFIYISLTVIIAQVAFFLNVIECVVSDVCGQLNLVGCQPPYDDEYAVIKD